MITYKYDLHVHSDETSPCGKVKAAELVRMYKNEGYCGIVMTDHYYDGFFEGLPDMCWKDKVDCYLKGYKIAHKTGLKIGLKVFLGIELRFKENDNDYLVYGIDEKFLLDYPELYKTSLSEFRKLISGTGILIFQAHPFRPYMITADPALLDGVEVYNGNPRQDSKNEKAAAFAEDNGLLGISGSDFHQPQDIARGGILLTDPVENVKELADAIKAGKISGLICTEF